MKDHLLISLAYNNEARIYVSYTKNLVEEARIIHNTWPTSTAAFGRLLTAASMMSFFNKDDSKLALRIEGNGPIGYMVAESNNVGEVRGIIDGTDVYLKYNDTNKLAVAYGVGAGTLTVIRNPQLKTPYTSSVELVSGEIAEDLTYYFTYSEQTPSSVGLGVLVDVDSSVKTAGGFIIQLLPSASEETIVQIEKALSELPSITTFFEDGKTTEDLLALLSNNNYKILEEHDLKYHCGCSKEHFLSMIAKLDADNIELFIKEDKGANVECPYCLKKYDFTVEELAQILKDKK